MNAIVRYRHIVISLSLVGLGALLIAATTWSFAGMASLAPQSTPPVIGRHCGGIGLVISETMCGCLWGHVRFQDDPPDAAPLSDVRVELHFAGDTIASITAEGLGEPAYYAMTAERLGARRGDSVTLSAEYAGYTVAKHVILDPDLETGEQQEDLVFPYPRPPQLPTPTPTPTPLPGASQLGWPREGYDLATTGYYPYPSTPILNPNAPFTQVWSYRLQKEGGHFFYVYTADVDGDAALEVVLAFYDTLQVLDRNGVALWSRTIPSYVGQYGSGELRLGMLADVTGDGLPEILVAQKTSEKVGNIFVYDGFGNLVTTFSWTVPKDGSFNVYAVLDGADGRKKVYAEIFSNWEDVSQRGSVLFDDGNGSQDWRYAAGRNLRPSIGDLDGDGDLELVSRNWVATHNVSSNCGYGWNTCTDDSNLWTVVLEQDGDEVWSRPLRDVPTGGELTNIVVDLDRNGTKEILALESHWDGAWHGGFSRVHLLDAADGHILRTFMGPYNVAWRGAVVTDLNRDGKDEVIAGSADGTVRVLNWRLNLVKQASVAGKEVRAVNDLNGDDRLEIVVTSHEGEYRVTVLRDDLTELWSQSFEGGDGTTQAIVSDLNGDQVNELLVSTTGGHLYVFSQATWSVPTPPTPTPLSTDFRSLILVHGERLARFHPAEAAQVPEVLAQLAQLADHPHISGTVVYLETYPDVVNAYLAWDAHWPDQPGVSAATTTAYANMVAESIQEVIQAQVQADPLIRYVVLVGDDRVIPHRRVQDRSPESFHEDTYPWIAVTTTVGAAMAAERILTDDFYGDVIPETDPRIAHVPDLAVGRLVESPSQILAVVNAFLASSGVVESPAFVAGYSLVSDLAINQRSLLNGDGAAVSFLIGDAWSAADLRSKLLETPNNLNAVNVHAVHWLYGAPMGGDLSAAEIISSSIPVGAVIFTPGCQAGLSVPADNGVYTGLDFAEVFAGRGASYVANTGWGIGDWQLVAFSERLYQELTGYLVAGDVATVGDSLWPPSAPTTRQKETWMGWTRRCCSRRRCSGCPNTG